MNFTKMHGAGNDYVYINCFEETVSDRPSLARLVSDRHFGIGSDGLICICPSDKADFKMDMYNADGSYSPMCGNGIRCVAKYVYDHGMTDKTVITVESGGSVKTLRLNIENGQVQSARVDMGPPVLTPEKIPVALDGELVLKAPITVDGREYEFTAVSMGNPHAVVFTADTDSLPLESIGPAFENHTLFPERANVEFVQVIDRSTLKMRVWERGSGETLACGTGACASLVASVLAGYTENSAKLILRGGELFAEWDREKNTVFLSGPAVTVFEGTINL